MACAPAIACACGNSQPPDPSRDDCQQQADARHEPVLVIRDDDEDVGLPRWCSISDDAAHQREAEGPMDGSHLICVRCPLSSMAGGSLIACSRLRLRCVRVCVTPYPFGLQLL